MKPEQLEIERNTDLASKRVVFIYLAKTSKTHRMSALETALIILEKEDRFKQIYGDIFSLADQREEVNKIITSLFENNSCWRIPIGTPLDDILSLG